MKNSKEIIIKVQKPFFAGKKTRVMITKGEISRKYIFSEIFSGNFDKMKKEKGETKWLNNIFIITQ